MGEGSFHRYPSLSKWATKSGNLTLSSKLVALGAMMVISEAVEALWSALAPDWANETLPTNTLCTTVLQGARQFSARPMTTRNVLHPPGLSQ